MGPYVKLKERKSGEIQYAYRWRQIWEEAKSDGKLANRGWPDDWDEFRFRRLARCDEAALIGPRQRKRKPGGGRKPDPDKMLIKQICLTRSQAEGVKLAAKAMGVSQSAWIREAIDWRLA